MSQLLFIRECNINSFERRTCSQFIFRILLIILLLAYKCANSQYYPDNYFRPPLDSALYLSAPFGSLRENHFHSGMDIRTFEKQGLAVYAAADGYISRIKIQSIGYGKAVYIDHPNGFRTVYGHLQQYAEPIGAYVKSVQYVNKKFEMDQFPEKSALPVKKGQLIGFSGNSGTSSGPHLHFEIRDIRNEEPLNPQLFGLPVMDTLSPKIKSIKVYTLDEQRPLEVLNREITSSNIIAVDSGWRLTDTLFVSPGRVGLSVEAVDYLIDPGKEYSIYRLDLSLDGRRYFSFALNRFSFDDTRYINAHIDYEIWKKEGTRFQKLFLDDGNRISLYPYLRNKGKLEINDSKIHYVRIDALDFQGKAFTLFCMLKSDPALSHISEVPICNREWLYPSRSNEIKMENLKILIPAMALYDTIPLCVEELAQDKNALSATFRVNDPYTPMHRSFSISIKPISGLNQSLNSKLLLAYSPKPSFTRPVNAEINEDGFVTGKALEFGNFSVAMDTISPVIKILSPEKDNIISDSASLKIKITDNFSGISSYKMTLDGKWVLSEFDAKNDLLEYYFDQNTPLSVVQLEITVCDRKNNCAILKRLVTFKPE